MAGGRGACQATPAADTRDMRTWRPRGPRVHRRGIRGATLGRVAVSEAVRLAAWVEILNRGWWRSCQPFGVADDLTELSDIAMLNWSVLSIGACDGAAGEG
jgi:hypothetical protein